ncbi:hypothetical protein P7D68_06355 [Enterococcus avium]|uniref:hypothetical protein n=1 Tax=Enterococcus avium TaxID=33945 RepID=UPI00288D70A8|nr:hypothetical protein [Enterococcus avium]MDT2469814.1 hypothetical protein [Enterococcus avium]
MKTTIINFFKLLLSIFIWISGAALILFLLKLLLNSLWILFTSILAKDSVLFQFSNIDFLSIIEISFFVAIILFLFFAITALFLVLLKESKVLQENNFNKTVSFVEKFLVALYPALVLAASLNDYSFSLITNIISFFAIFTFIFKRDSFN